MNNKPLGIVIPTHNRRAALLQCLDHLEKQTFSDFEVIVVDDGSKDDTAEQMQSYQKRTPLSLRYLLQANSGPAKARNLGISMLDAPVCLMIGDDIFASPTLVEKHLSLHRQYEDIRVAAVGLTRWSSQGQTVTPFMRWLDGDLQFAYPLLLSGTKPDWHHFWTSNLSVKTELLRRFPFNEIFPYAAMEDMELAYRIENSVGLELKFIPEATAEHLHPTTFRQSCARMVRVGYSTGLFWDLWPEQLPSGSRGMRHSIVEILAHSPRLLRFLTHAFGLFADKLDPRGTPIPYILSAHFAIGRRNQLQSRNRRDQPEPVARPA